MHSAPHQGPLGLPAGMLPASVASPLGSTFGPVQGPATTPPGESLSASSSARPCVSDTTETSAAVPHASHAGAAQETSSLQVSSTAVQGHQLQALHSCLDTLMAASWPAQSGARASVQPCSPIRVLARICLKHIFRVIHVYIVACGPKACGRATNFAILGPSSSV